MRRSILLICVTYIAVGIPFGFTGCTQDLQPTSIKAIPFTDVEITDTFWGISS